MSGFASTTDLADKRVSFEELGPSLYGYTAEGDPNSGVVVGDDGVLVVDAQATPHMAADVVARIREATDKPVTHLVLTHYHAVRVLGAAGYPGALPRTPRGR
jgi:glyoxylase-like metal-dependent hydrolase (beta-lactamase superfamily II)